MFAKSASGVNALGVRGSQPTAGQGETGEVQTAKPRAVKWNQESALGVPAGA